MNQCLDQHQGDCQGEVEQRTLDGLKWWPRCERHFEARVERYDGSLEQFAHSATELVRPGSRRRELG